jgi:uncharacterized protein
MEQYDDKNFSFVDCVSFAVMHEHSLSRAFAFYKHFTQAGFEMLQVPSGN